MPHAFLLSNQVAKSDTQPDTEIWNKRVQRSSPIPFAPPAAVAARQYGASCGTTMMKMKLIGLALILICNGWAQTDSRLQRYMRPCRRCMLRLTYRLLIQAVGLY